MSISVGSRWFVAALLAAGMTVAALFVYVRWKATSIDDFYVVTDSFVDATAEQAMAVQFVRVEVYDTTKILRVGVELAAKAVADPALDQSRQRSLMMHFYTATDTSALTDVEIDELAYTNPEITTPGSRLLAVRNGYVMTSDYRAGTTIPSKAATLRQSTYFMPRPGVRASDLR